MKRAILIMLMAFAFALVTFLNAPAYALCNVNGGEIAQIHASVNVPGSMTVTVIPPENLRLLPVPFFFTFTTTDAVFMQIAAAAHAGNKIVNVGGDALSCGAAGTFRSGGALGSISMR